MNKDTIEEIVKEFWKTFNDLALVRQMRSVAGDEQSGMVKDLEAVVEDREATVLIRGEFDKYAIDDFLRQALQKSFHAGLQRAVEIAEGMKSNVCTVSDCEHTDGRTCPMVGKNDVIDALLHALKEEKG